MKRAFLDTNVLIRYATADIPEKAARAEKLLQEAEAGKLKLVLNVLIVAETVWVLESYDFAKKDIAAFLLTLLGVPNIEVPQKRAVAEALGLYENKNIDFVDAYSVVYMKHRKIRPIYSYDKKHMRRISWMELREP